MLILIRMLLLNFHSDSDSDSNSNANSNANVGVNKLLFFRNNSGLMCEMTIKHHTQHNVALFWTADICDDVKDFLRLLISRRSTIGSLGRHTNHHT